MFILSAFCLRVHIFQNYAKPFTRNSAAFIIKMVTKKCRAETRRVHILPLDRKGGQALNRKEKNELAALWAEYAPPLGKIAEVKLRSCPDEAPDAVSETFTALAEYVSENGMPENPAGWLYGALHNIINMKYREKYRKAEKEVSLDSGEYKLPFVRDDIDKKTDEIYNAQIKDRLAQLLTEDEYQLICAIHFDKMKMKEIAAQNNTTEAAVKQKHYRICRKLKKRLQNSKNFF